MFHAAFSWVMQTSSILEKQARIAYPEINSSEWIGGEAGPHCTSHQCASTQAPLHPSHSVCCRYSCTCLCTIGSSVARTQRVRLKLESFNSSLAQPHIGLRRDFRPISGRKSVASSVKTKVLLHCQPPKATRWIPPGNLWYFFAERRAHVLPQTFITNP